MSQGILARDSMPRRTVFISYAHESGALRASVKALADWLGNHGCTVLTDHPYVHRPPEQGWPVWMHDCVREADVVLVVCTPKLKARYEKNEEPGTGRGATFEGAIITQHLYENAMRNNRFYPVLPDKGGREVDIPTTLKAWWNGHRFPSGNEGIRRMIFADLSPAPAPAPAPAPIWSYPVTYIQELFELVSGPKRFIAQRRAKGTLTIERALAFFALSALIFSSVPPYTGIIGDILFVPVKVVSYGLGIFFAWRLVGGTAKLLDYLPIIFYYSPIFSFLIIISNRISLGVLLISDEGLYRNVMEAIKIGNITIGIELFKTANPLVIGFGALSCIIIFSWYIAGWGAYRALNGASRRRSVLAAVLFLALNVPIFGILSLIASVLLAEAGLA